MLKFKTGNQIFFLLIPTIMLSSTKNVHKEPVHKKAALLAEMAKVDELEKETMREEATVACNADAVWLAEEKAARKAVKKGKKHVVEESGANAGAKGPKPKKRVKMIEGGWWQESLRGHQGLLQKVSVHLNFLAFIDCGRCVANKQECAWVWDGHAKSCLACSKAKQKCIGVVWEHGEGASGEVLGVTVRDLGGMAAMIKEMVEGQKSLVEEIRNLGELVEGIFWGQDPVEDSKEYTEWLEELSEGELEKKLNELELEQVEYREFLRGLDEKQDEELVVVENEGGKNN